MKRYFYSALVALFLIFSLAGISPAASAEEITIPFFFVDFNGSLVITEWPGDGNWQQALKEDHFGRIDGITYSYQYAYPALIYDPDNDGIGECYTLVYTGSDGRKMFVHAYDGFITYPYNEIQAFIANHPNYTNDDVFSNFDHYETVCTIRLQLGVGKEYDFTYPTSIWFWQDLVKQPDYEHPDLGTCRFEVADGSVFLNIRSDSGNSQKYSLYRSSGGLIFPTDFIFSNDVAETDLISLVPLCPEGKHELVSEIKTYPSCSTEGSKVLSCTKCGYSVKHLIQANGHFFSKLIRTYEPTCPEVGYKVYQCSGCTETRKVDIPIKHNYTPATCTAGSSCTGCGICNALPLGHDRNWLGACSRCKNNSVVDFVGNVGDFIADGADDLWNGAKDVFEDVKDGAENVIEGSKEKVSSFFTIIAVTAGLAIAIPIVVFFVRLFKK